MVVQTANTPAASEQEKPYGAPTHTGHVLFTPPNCGPETQYETFYSIYGDLGSGKTPLIGLHGGPGSTSLGLDPLAFLTKKYGIPVVLYDQLGCGRSTHLPERKGDTDFWTSELFVSELRNLIKALAISDFYLWGTSWGGMLALRFALEKPAGLQKLILSSSTAVIEWMNESVREWVANLPAAKHDALIQCDATGQYDSPEYKETMTDFARHTICRVWPFPRELQEMLATSAEDTTVYNTLYGPSMLRQTGPLKQFDIRPDLHRITSETVPGGVLVARGRFDIQGERVVAPFITEIRAKVEAVTFEKSAHVPLLEETEEYIKVLGQFLAPHMVFQ